MNDFNDKVKFDSGATSGGKAAPYGFCTWTGFKRTAQRFWYGQQKHANSDTVVANANWLKAFHARDLSFFHDRINHAIEHLQKEMQGNFDPTPGGNWGGVGWAVEVLSYVDEYDHDFYLAVVGLIAHPGERKDACQCPRCLSPARAFGEPVPETGHALKTNLDAHRYQEGPLRSRRSIISPIPSYKTAPSPYDLAGIARADRKRKKK